MTRRKGEPTTEHTVHPAAVAVLDLVARLVGGEDVDAEFRRAVAWWTGLGRPVSTPNNGALRRYAVLQTVAEHPDLGLSEVAEIVGISRELTRWHVLRLQNDGLLVRRSNPNRYKRLRIVRTGGGRSG